MPQQIIALVVIIYFIVKLVVQKKNKRISGNEFSLWLVFWLFAAAAVVLIKWIDRLVVGLGFSASGIDVILYLGIAVIFYLIFRLRLKMERIEGEITKIVRKIALDEAGREGAEKNKRPNL